MLHGIAGFINCEVYLTLGALDGLLSLIAKALCL